MSCPSVVYKLRCYGNSWYVFCKFGSQGDITFLFWVFGWESFETSALKDSRKKDKIKRSMCPANENHLYSQSQIYLILLCWKALKCRTMGDILHSFSRDQKCWSWSNVSSSAIGWLCCVFYSHFDNSNTEEWTLFGSSLLQNNNNLIIF